MRDPPDCLEAVSGAVRWRGVIDGEVREYPLQAILRSYWRGGRSPHGGLPPAVSSAASTLNLSLAASASHLCALSTEATERELEVLTATRRTQGLLESLPGASRVRTAQSSTPDARFPVAFEAAFNALCAPVGLDLDAWQAAETAQRCGEPGLRARSESPTEGLVFFMSRAASVAYRAVAQQGRGVILSFDHVSLSTALDPAGPLDWRADTVYWPRLARAMPSFLGGGCGWWKGAHAASRSRVSAAQRHGIEPTLRWTYVELRTPSAGPAAGAAAAHNATRSLRAVATACTLNGLLRPRDDVVPGFSRLRAALTARGTLAIGLYLRTGEAETNHLHERPSCPAHELLGHRQRRSAALLCALQLEQRWAAGFSRVVWFVASDSVEVRAPLGS